MNVLFAIFFFQAEDGIRAIGVTGVQTCALPILAIRAKRAGVRRIVVLERAETLGGTWRDNHYPGCACDVPTPLYSYSFARSEERRVGKECRSRGVADHQQKKDVQGKIPETRQGA